jgi:hypothetical protein
MRKVRVGRTTKKVFSWHTQMTVSSTACKQETGSDNTSCTVCKRCDRRKGSLNRVANGLPYPSLTNQNLSGIANAVCATICTELMQQSSFRSRCRTVRAKQHNGECGDERLLQILHQLNSSLVGIYRFISLNRRLRCEEASSR